MAWPKIHGLAKTRGYNVWKAMMRRCYNEKCSDYHYYGGRGIAVSDDWHSPEGFIADMGQPPEGLTLERKDNNGDYEPGNCKWASWREQSRNRRGIKMNQDRVRTIRRLRANGFTIASLAGMFGVRTSTISNVVNEVSWTEEQAKELEI